MSVPARPTFGQSMAILLASGALAAGLVLGIAWLVGRVPELERAAVAVALVLPAFVLTFWFAAARSEKGPQFLLFAFMGGSAVRGGVSLLGGVLLYKLVPFFDHTLFLGWLVALYLFSLVVETLLILRLATAAGVQQVRPQVGHTEGMAPHGCR